MKLQKFMAIGGSSLNKSLVSKIDQRIIEMSNKKNPISTAKV